MLKKKGYAEMGSISKGGLLVTFLELHSQQVARERATEDGKIQVVPFRERFENGNRHREVDAIKKFREKIRLFSEKASLKPELKTTIESIFSETIDSLSTKERLAYEERKGRIRQLYEAVGGELWQHWGDLPEDPMSQDLGDRFFRFLNSRDVSNPSVLGSFLKRNRHPALFEGVLNKYREKRTRELISTRPAEEVEQIAGAQAASMLRCVVDDVGIKNLSFEQFYTALSAYLKSGGKTILVPSNDFVIPYLRTHFLTEEQIKRLNEFRFFHFADEHLIQVGIQKKIVAQKVVEGLPDITEESAEKILEEASVLVCMALGEVVAMCLGDLKNEGVEIGIEPFLPLFLSEKMKCFSDRALSDLLHAPTPLATEEFRFVLEKIDHTSPQFEEAVNFAFYRFAGDRLELPLWEMFKGIQNLLSTLPLEHEKAARQKFVKIFHDDRGWYGLGFLLTKIPLTPLYCIPWIAQQLLIKVWGFIERLRQLWHV